MTAHVRIPLALTTLAAALTGCGGGDTPSASTDTVVISGVAATGKAVPAGSVVTLKCAAGTASATTDGQGAFSVPAAALTLPCLAEVAFVQDGTSQKLHSLATALGTTNITPLTEVIVAQAMDTADVTQSFVDMQPATLAQATTRLASAQARVAQVLTDAGLTPPVNAFTDLLVPAPLSSPGSVGNTHDQLLEALKAKFNTIAALVTAVRATPAPSPSPSPAPVASYFAATVDWSQCTTPPHTNAAGLSESDDCTMAAVTFVNFEQLSVDDDGANIRSVTPWSWSAGIGGTPGKVMGTSLHASIDTPTYVMGTYVGLNTAETLSCYIRHTSQGWGVLLVGSESGYRIQNSTLLAYNGANPSNTVRIQADQLGLIHSYVIPGYRVAGAAGLTPEKYMTFDNHGLTGMSDGSISCN